MGAGGSSHWASSTPIVSGQQLDVRGSHSAAIAVMHPSNTVFLSSLGGAPAATASHVILQLACALPPRWPHSVSSQYHIELADMVLRMPQVIEQEFPSLDRVPWNRAGRGQIVLRQFGQYGLRALAHLLEVFKQRGF